MPLAGALGLPLGAVDGLVLSVGVPGVALASGKKPLGEAVETPGSPDREIRTAAATAAPTNTTTPAMIKISFPRDPNGPEPSPPGPGG